VDLLAYYYSSEIVIYILQKCQPIKVELVDFVKQDNGPFPLKWLYPAISEGILCGKAITNLPNHNPGKPKAATRFKPYFD
jgi:hypothetical protein